MLGVKRRKMHISVNIKSYKIKMHNIFLEETMMNQ